MCSKFIFCLLTFTSFWLPISPQNPLTSSCDNVNMDNFDYPKQMGTWYKVFGIGNNQSESCGLVNYSNFNEAGFQITFDDSSKLLAIIANGKTLLSIEGNLYQHVVSTNNSENYIIVYLCPVNDQELSELVWVLSPSSIFDVMDETLQQLLIQGGQLCDYQADSPSTTLPASPESSSTSAASITASNTTTPDNIEISTSETAVEETTPEITAAPETTENSTNKETTSEISTSETAAEETTYEITTLPETTEHSADEDTTNGISTSETTVEETTDEITTVDTTVPDTSEISTSETTVEDTTPEITTEDTTINETSNLETKTPEITKVPETTEQATVSTTETALEEGTQTALPDLPQGFKIPGSDKIFYFESQIRKLLEN